MSRREYTQNVKIDMPPLIAKIRHDAIVKMKNTSWLYLWRFVSARTYQNLDENWSIFTEIQSIFQKYANDIICKLKFWVRRPLWWRHELIECQMRHEIKSPTHNLSKYEKELGVSIHSEELQWILYRHVFAHICYVLQELARMDIYLERRQSWWRHELIEGSNGLYLERTLISLLMVIKR